MSNLIFLFASLEIKIEKGKGCGWKTPFIDIEGNEIKKRKECSASYFANSFLAILYNTYCCFFKVLMMTLPLLVGQPSRT